MSKKSRKNLSKPATGKTAGSVSRSTAKKADKTMPQAKSTAMKKAAKTAKPVRKTVAKTAKAPVAKKAPAAKTSTAKTSAAKAATKPATAVKPVAVKAASGKAVPISFGTAAEGARAPDFRLPRDGGANVSLSDYAGQTLVIFFYPRASTPGCTKEASDFTRLSADFEAAGAVVLGVSADPLKAQESFRDKYGLSVPLLSDTTQSMLKAYGAWGEKSMYGKVFEGVLRTTVLIDKTGQVAKIWRNVRVDGHADEVLEEVRRI